MLAKQTPCICKFQIACETVRQLGLQKNRSMVSLYDRTGVCTIRTLIKNDQNDLRAGTRAEFRPFSEALPASGTLFSPSVKLIPFGFPFAWRDILKSWPYLKSSKFGQNDMFIVGSSVERSVPLA